MPRHMQCREQQPSQLPEAWQVHCLQSSLQVLPPLQQVRAQLELHLSMAGLLTAAELKAERYPHSCIQLEMSTRWLPASRMENGQQAGAWGWRLHMLNIKGVMYPLM